MSKPMTTIRGEEVWDLPPLILHPFNERMPPTSLLDHSKAALMLSGVLPSDGSDTEELTRRVLAGRYTEIRMLFFLGKDILRWMAQCVEWAERIPELAGADIHRQSFAGLLTANPPETVAEKLVRWGVADYVAIFKRAIGLNALYADPPHFDCLAAEFLQNYHRYADYMFRCYMEAQPHSIIANRNFRFDLYASGEYTRLLETQWGES